MSGRGNTGEQIIGILKEQEAGAHQLWSCAASTRCDVPTFYNWKSKCGGLESFIHKSRVNLVTSH